MKLSTEYILSQISQKFFLASPFAYEWYTQQQIFPSTSDYLKTTGQDEVFS